MTEAMRKLERNRLLVEYREKHPEVSWSKIGEFFNISGQRAWEIYNDERKRKARGARRIKTVPKEQQYQVFRKYTRKWLSQVTGFSQGYLCRVATGKASLSRSFIDRVCYKLNRPEEELFSLKQVS